MVGVRSTSNVGEVIYSLLRMQPPEISSITGLCVLDTLTATSKISLAAGLQLSVALAMVVVYLFAVGGVACVRWLQVGTWACWLCVKPPWWWDWGVGSGDWVLGASSWVVNVSCASVEGRESGAVEEFGAVACSGRMASAVVAGCVCLWLAGAGLLQARCQICRSASGGSR